MVSHRRLTSAGKWQFRNDYVCARRIYYVIWLHNDLFEQVIDVRVHFGWRSSFLGKDVLRTVVMLDLTEGTMIL